MESISPLGTSDRVPTTVNTHSPRGWVTAQHNDERHDNGKFARMRPEDAFIKLEELILEERYDLLLMAMDAVRYVEDNDVLIQAVLSISETHNRTYPLLRQAIYQEITNFTAKALFLISGSSLSPETEKLSISSFFREGSTATHLLSSWMFREGEPYLQRTLYPFVSNICKNDLCFEVDPHREPDVFKVEANLTKLLCMAKQMVEHICCSLNSVPILLRRVLCYLGSEIKQRFPEEVNMVLSGFFFLRFLCPALATPNYYGVCKDQPSPIAGRSLILLSKLLQTVSTGAEFGTKEEYLSMPALNAFVTSYSPLLSRFFSLLIEEDLVPGSLSRDSIPSTTDWLFSSGTTALSASGTNKSRTLSVDSQLSTSPTGSSLSSSAALLASSPRRNRALTQLSAYFERNGMPPAPSPLSQSPLSHSFLASSSPPQGHLSAPLAPSPQPSFTPQNGFSAQFPATVAITAASVVQQSKPTSSPPPGKRSRVLNNFKVATIRGSKGKKPVIASPTVPEQDFVATHANAAAIRIIRELAGEVIDLRTKLADLENQNRQLDHKNQRISKRLKLMLPQWEDTETETEAEDRDKCKETETETDDDQHNKDSSSGSDVVVLAQNSVKEVVVLIGDSEPLVLLANRDEKANRELTKSLSHKRKSIREAIELLTTSDMAPESTPKRMKKRRRHRSDRSDPSSSATTVLTTEGGIEATSLREEQEHHEASEIIPAMRRGSEDHIRRAGMETVTVEAVTEQASPGETKGAMASTPENSEMESPAPLPREVKEQKKRKEKKKKKKHKVKKRKKGKEKEAKITDTENVAKRDQVNQKDEESENKKKNKTKLKSKRKSEKVRSKSDAIATVASESISAEEKKQKKKKKKKKEKQRRKKDKIERKERQRLEKERLEQAAKERQEREEKEAQERALQERQQREQEEKERGDKRREEKRMKKEKKSKKEKKGKKGKQEKEKERHKEQETKSLEGGKEERSRKRPKKKAKSDGKESEANTDPSKKRSKERITKRKKKKAIVVAEAGPLASSGSVAMPDPTEAFPKREEKKKKTKKRSTKKTRQPGGDVVQEQREENRANASGAVVPLNNANPEGVPSSTQGLAQPTMASTSESDQSQPDKPNIPEYQPSSAIEQTLAAISSTTGGPSGTKKEEEYVNGVKDEEHGAIHPEPQSAAPGNVHSAGVGSEPTTAPLQDDKPCDSETSTNQAACSSTLGPRKLSGATRAEMVRPKVDENAALEEFKRKQKELTARRKRNSILVGGSRFQWLQEIYGEDGDEEGNMMACSFDQVPNPLDRYTREGGASATASLPRNYSRSRAQTLDDIFVALGQGSIDENPPDGSQTDRASVSELKRRFNAPLGDHTNTNSGDLANGSLARSSDHIVGKHSRISKAKNLSGTRRVQEFTKQPKQNSSNQLIDCDGLLTQEPANNARYSPTSPRSPHNKARSAIHKDECRKTPAGTETNELQEVFESIMTKRRGGSLRLANNIVKKGASTDDPTRQADG